MIHIMLQYSAFDSMDAEAGSRRKRLQSCCSAAVGRPELTLAPCALQGHACQVETCR